MNPDNTTGRDDEFLELLAAYEEALSAGRSPRPAAGVPPELAARLERAQACLQRLKRDRLAVDAPVAHAISQFGSGQGLAFNATGGLAQLGRFRLVRELGRGGCGIVYLAEDPLLRRTVALKVPRPEALETPELRQRFLREARAAADLDHPNVVAVHEVGEVGPFCYLISAYCPGQTLEAWLREQPGPVLLHTAAEIVATIAEAVHYVHGRGILHRDLKPANILVDGGGPSASKGRPLSTIKITDFGLAKWIEAAEGETKTGMVVGTPLYMAPEQAEGRTRAVGPATDVYALGVILYRLLTGRLPFLGANEVDTVRRIVGEEPLEPRRLRLDVSLDLQTVCLKCLRKEPGQRYAGAGELAEDLRRFLRGEPVLARPLSAPQRAWAWARRRPTAAALIGVSAAALLLLQLGVWWHLHSLGQSNAELAAALAGEQRESERANVGQAQARFEQARAEEQAARAQHHAYVSQIHFAAQAVEGGQPWRAVKALNSLRPRPGEPDRRGLEWYEVWRNCRREGLFLAGHSNAIVTIAFSPDSRNLASTSQDTTIKLWDATTGQLQTTLFQEHLEGLPEGLSTVAFSPDGRTLVSSRWDKPPRLWDVATGKDQGQLVGPAAKGGEEYWALVSSPNGQWLACSRKNQTIQLWDWANRRPHLLLTPGHLVDGLAFSPDSRRLAASGVMVTVWEAASGREEMVLKGPTQATHNVAFSPDGRTLAAGGDDRTIYLWDLATAQLRRTLQGHTNPIQTVAFSPDGTLLASGSPNEAVRLWDMRTGQERCRFPHKGGGPAIVFSPDGRTLAYSQGEPHLVVLHDLTRALAGPSAPPTPGRFRLKAWSVAFAPDGRTLASASQNLRVTLWDPTTGRVRSRLPLLWTDVYTVAYSPDGRTLAAGTAAGMVVLFDTTSGRVRATLKAHRARVTAVAFAPDGTTLASASWDKTVKLWDVAMGQLRETLEGHANDVHCLAYSPDGQTLASGGKDDFVLLWSAATGRRQAILRGNGRVGALAFSPDGRTLAVGQGLGYLTLWDCHAGQARATLPGHAGGIKSLAYSPDGHTLASAGLDKTIKLWDLTTEQELLTMTRHTGEVNAVAFAPDGKVLASASHDGTVQFWRAAELPEP
jgi:WD40 repeat protein/tRNA A-37 threonylcarbamoyl transferase component Bud32